MDNNLPLKILADGTQVPSTDTRTDHVAVLFPDTGWIVGVAGLSDKGRAFRNADLADKAAAKLDLLGETDWINAPLDEVWLRHVLRHDRHDPAVDTNLFPNLPRGDWYHTSTKTPWSEASAFSVNLYLGLVYDNLRLNSGFGLACRRARQ